MTEQSYTLTLSFDELRWLRAALLKAEDLFENPKNNDEVRALNALQNLLKKVIEVEK